MKILFIGDVVAGPGRSVVNQVLPSLKKELEIDVVFANAENISSGRGITKEKLDDLIRSGVDYFSSGDHVYWERGTDEAIDNWPVVIPANYPKGNPGKRYHIIDTGAKGKVLLINVYGRTAFFSLPSYMEDPFATVDQILEETKGENVKEVIVDFHAESTSEKMAMGFYLDGRVSGVVGTHTHVPTADNMPLPKGTLYVTDIGMTGIIDSILGVKKEIILQLFKTARNQRFEWESTGRKAFRSVLLDTDEKSITRIDKVFAS